MQTYDVIIAGAGAAGLMCAAAAGRRGRSVLVVDQSRAPAEKVRISGGGRCNFTHLDASPRTYLSDNPRFCISALSRYSPRDFLALVERHNIAWTEKTPGQLFCQGSATQIVDMLINEARAAGAEIRLSAALADVERRADGFSLTVGGRPAACGTLVVATGGLSIPKMGSSGFAYELARRFGLRLVEPRPGLVPFLHDPSQPLAQASLAGVSLAARAKAGKAVFEDGLLFTHRGLSGPAALQISSYWRAGEPVTLDLAPGCDLKLVLEEARRHRGRTAVSTLLSEILPRRLALALTEAAGVTGAVAETSGAAVRALCDAVHAWRWNPPGTEGYRTAEVTVGGVDTRDLDSRTLAARSDPSLVFIGEAVDVTGWLGGYNFQWAWASGWCAGQTV